MKKQYVCEDSLIILISSGSFRFCSKIPNPDQYAFGIGKFQISTVVLKFSNEFLWYSYNDTTQSILSWKWYPEQFQKPHNLYKIKLTTSTRSHVNKNKHKKDNWFREHFEQNLSSQNTRNGVSEHQQSATKWVETLRPKVSFFTFYELQKEEI